MSAFGLVTYFVYQSAYGQSVQTVLVSFFFFNGMLFICLFDNKNSISQYINTNFLNKYPAGCMKGLRMETTQCMKNMQS